MSKKLSVFSGVLISFSLLTNSTYAISQDIDNKHKQHCELSGGMVEPMTAEIGTGAGTVQGLSTYFCNFYDNDTFASIGLETFATDRPNIAATFMKKLHELDKDSPLWKGPNANPSQNVCKNLGGAAIGFVANGGFANKLGQSDICVFGDGSMASAWSMIYMANKREGFEDIKNSVKSEPLAINIVQ